MARVVEAKAREAIATTAAAAKKRAAAPEWSDLVHAFPDGRLDHDANGKPVGFKYPESADPAKQARINAKAVELWEPHRRLDTALGAEHNATVPAVRLLNRRTGRTETVPVSVAERKARKAGMVEERKRGRPLVSGTLGRLMWKDIGRGEWYPSPGLHCNRQPVGDQTVEFDPAGNPWTWHDGRWQRRRET